MTRFIAHYDTARGNTLQFTVTSSLAVARWRLPTADVSFLWVTELSPGSPTS
jgi:hypothetical protein